MDVGKLAFWLSDMQSVAADEPGSAIASSTLPTSYAPTSKLPITANQVTIHQQDADLQTVVDAAPPFAILVCDRNQEQIISETVILRKPITLVGLNGRLPEGLGRTLMLQVESEQVTITDFRMIGNATSVEQTSRAPLVRVRFGNFRIERGWFENSSKDGIEVSPLPDAPDIVGGTIRDIVGKGCVRDVVSLSGTAGGRDPKIRNILVDNIRGYDSSLRGTVEVSDGTDQITVRKVYAERCVYAIDVQDHNRNVEVNHNILIEDVSAVACKHAVRTANRPFGHSNLTLRNITAHKCSESLKISNTARVTIQNIRIEEQHGDRPPLQIRNCAGITIRDLVLTSCNPQVVGLSIVDCDHVLIDGVSLLDKSPEQIPGIAIQLSSRKSWSHFNISNVRSHSTILLEKTDKAATLTDYIISGNLAIIDDRFGGDRRLVVNNVSPTHAR